MNEPGPVTSGDARPTRFVFVSYATADRKEALSVCKAIERRGTRCWISTRDVEPGGNYQEEIVRAIRNACAMVLVFSEAANNSDEIKKELSLASRYRVPVMALRIEDVEPSDAFAYELSTRQWIDAFEGWDKSIDMLMRKLGQVTGAEDSAQAPTRQAEGRRRASHTSRRPVLLVAALALVVALAAGLWIFLSPPPAAAHSMQVRLTGFERLSPDIPATMPAAMRDEIIAAFSDDGVVNISTASAPPSGDAPAYALGGTIRRDGDKIKVIARLTNERTGATLWSNIFNYDWTQLPRAPRRFSVDAGNLVRCGLFGASTYRRPLPDAVLTNYLQVCHNINTIEFEPGKALDFAKKVVAAVPDFSWGWSGVEIAAFQGSVVERDSTRAHELRKLALDAAGKAISLDPTNSEALTFKSMLLDPADFEGQEKLLKAAIAARPLPCGCEHHIYGYLLQNVGRYAEAVDEFRRSTDVLPLDGGAQLELADSLLVSGRSDEAKSHLEAAIDLDPSSASTAAVMQAPATGNYVAALKAIDDPALQLPPEKRAAEKAAFEALMSSDSRAKALAVRTLSALPPLYKARVAATLLAALGARREALQVVVDAAAAKVSDATSWLFLPNMRGVLSEPDAPAVLQRLGLMRYWKASHTKPDVCSAKNAPPFCRAI